MQGEITEEKNEQAEDLNARFSDLKIEKRTQDARIGEILQGIARRLRAYAQRYAASGGVFRGGGNAVDAFSGFCRLLVEVEPEIREMEGGSLMYSTLEERAREVALEAIRLAGEGDETEAFGGAVTEWLRSLEEARAELQRLCREQIPRFLAESSEAADLANDGTACAPARVALLCGTLAGMCDAVRVRFQ